jgi:hypothetical protein
MSLESASSASVSRCGARAKHVFKKATECAVAIVLTAIAEACMSSRCPCMEYNEYTMRFSRYRLLKEIVKK